VPVLALAIVASLEIKPLGCCLRTLFHIKDD